jgi:hypothetical protein
MNIRSCFRDTFFWGIVVFYSSVQSQTGSILREYWNGISGITIPSLTGNVNFPSNPTVKTYLTDYFEAPSNWNDNYGTRIRGYVHPPVTGNYIFWIAGDDHCELWLSTDDKQAHKQKIAYHQGYTASRAWTTYTTQQSSAIYLEAGKRYYIEALHKEGTSNDNLAVGWQLPGATYERPIPASRLSPVLDDDDYSLWSRSAKVHLNTTATGASVTGNVTNFQMLVRLDAGNFQFNTAQGNGADIRFAKPDGTHLYYQIEQWDSLAQQAQIWVKIDTVYGNNSTQYIEMLWGKSGVVSRSSGNGVYDTLNGFKGVWHCSQSPSSTAPQFPDASATGNNGTAQGGMTTSDLVDGVIGKCLDFDGIDDYISTSKQYTNPTTITISAWFKTTTNQGGKIIGFGNSQTGSSTSYDKHIYMDNSGKVYFGIYNGSYNVLASTSMYNNGIWHQVIGQQSSSGMKLFVDGVQVASNSVTSTQNYSGYWRIGYDNLTGWSNAPSSQRFSGQIDEVSVTYSASTSDRLKLSFESRKTGASWLSIESTYDLPLISLVQHVAAVAETSLTTNVINVSFSVSTPRSSPVSLSANLGSFGSAQSITDFDPLPGSVNVLLAADSTHATVPLYLTPFEDTLNEGDEIVGVYIIPDTTYRLGTNDSAAIQITDNDQKYPPQITANPVNLSVLEGDPATFSVSVTGTPPFTYQWRRNGIPTGSGSGLYSIPFVTRADSGARFDCIVINGAGRDTSGSALLSVSLRPEAPIIIRHPQAQLLAEGDSAELSIAVTGTAPFTFQWFCNGTAIAGATDSVYRNGPVSLGDNGKNIYCIVTNNVAGVQSRNALLTVRRPSSQTVIITGDLLTSRSIRVGIQDETRMNFIVRLYASVTSDSAIYTEAFLDSNNQAIMVKDGKFAIHLGSGTTGDNLMEVVRTYPNIFVAFSIASIGGNFETLDRKIPFTASPYALSSLPQVLKGIVNPDSAMIEAPIGTHYVRISTNDTYIRTFRGWARMSD